MTLEVLSGVLTADAMVALKHDRRLPIEQEQGVVIRLVEQARRLDPGDCSLLPGADVDKLDGRAAFEQCLEIRR